MAMGDVLGRLAVILGLDTAAFETGARRATSEASKMRAGMTKAAGAIAGAFAGMLTIDTLNQIRSMGQAAVDAAGGLGEQAAALGISTAALQEYRYAATQVGLSSQEMDLAFSQLTRRLGDAANGTQEPAEALKRLGISIDEIKGKRADEVMPLIADGMAKIKDPATQASIAVDLFGKSGQKLATLLQGGSAEIDSLRKAANDLGIVLSESDITKADEVADKVAALQYVLEAQQNKKLLENADTLLAYEQAVSNFKMAFITGVTELESANQSYNAALLDFNAALRANLSGALTAVQGWASNLGGAVSRVPAAFAAMANSASAWVGRMVDAIRATVIGKLNAVWAAVETRIERVKGFFFNLYDAVVGHSYVPDMVDEIGQHMNRLQNVMVDPAQKATRKAGEAFRDLAGDVASLMDRLFPEQARLRALQLDLATIDAASKKGPKGEAPLLSEAVADEARFRALGGGREMTVSDGLLDQGPLGNIAGTFESTMDRLAKATGGLADKTRISTVKVADSFKDMAEKSLDALEGMVSAIKGGGFLDILSSAVGLFLQLGSTGIFGAGLAKNINSVPKYAGGTDNHPGGLAWVGERGPELVSMPRASKVFTNRESMGMMGGRLQVEVVANNNGFGAIIRNEAGQMIAEASPAIARGGAALAGQQASFHNSRRLA